MSLVSVAIFISAGFRIPLGGSRDVYPAFSFFAATPPADFYQISFILFTSRHRNIFWRQIARTLALKVLGYSLTF